MGQAATTWMGRIADRFERYFFPVVFACLAFKDSRRLIRDWPGIQPALADIDPLDLTTGDFITVASILMLVYLIFQSLLSGYLLVRRNSTPNRTPDNWQEIVIPLLATFGAMGNSLLLSFYPAEWDAVLIPDTYRIPATVVGSVLVSVGLVISLRAEWQLNTSFGIFVQVREPVMTGMYSYVRHPMYSTYCFVNLGIVLLNPKASFLCCSLFFISILIYRATLEEAKLSDYSPEYREYKKRTPMIVPNLFPRAAKMPKRPKINPVEPAQ